eukprot:Lankesteria_metandrocarpae@DN220_c0_g1_i1.p1
MLRFPFGLWSPAIHTDTNFQVNSQNAGIDTGTADNGYNHISGGEFGSDWRFDDTGQTDTAAKNTALSSLDSSLFQELTELHKRFNTADNTSTDTTSTTIKQSTDHRDDPDILVQLRTGSTDVTNSHQHIQQQQRTSTYTKHDEPLVREPTGCDHFSGLYFKDAFGRSETEKFLDSAFGSLAALVSMTASEDAGFIPRPLQQPHTIEEDTTVPSAATVPLPSAVTTAHTPTELGPSVAVISSEQNVKISSGSTTRAAPASPPPPPPPPTTTPTTPTTTTTTTTPATTTTTARGVQHVLPTTA